MSLCLRGTSCKLDDPVLCQTYLYSHCPQWARQVDPGPDLVFPEPDLMDSLLHLYFSMYNNYAPVLHGPLLFAAIADGLHLRDPDFGSVILLACALGARFSDDPRVLLDEEREQARRNQARGQAGSEEGRGTGPAYAGRLRRAGKGLLQLSESQPPD